MIRLSKREFAKLVRRAYRQLPLNIRHRLDNVDISVEDWPNAIELDLPDDNTLFGLYTGVPLTEREGGDPILPDQITIFRRPILGTCATPAEAMREVQITLWHEVGHYLGLDEDALYRLGYG